jgi:hypothetical protein
MSEPTADVPVEQAVKFLIDRAGQFAASGAYGEITFRFQAGKLTTCDEKRTHKFQDMAPVVRSNRAGR